MMNAAKEANRGFVTVQSTGKDVRLVFIAPATSLRLTVHARPSA